MKGEKVGWLLSCLVIYSREVPMYDISARSALFSQTLLWTVFFLPIRWYFLLTLKRLTVPTPSESLAESE